MGHMLKLLNEQNKIVLCMKPEYWNKLLDKGYKVNKV